MKKSMHYSTKSVRMAIMTFFGNRLSKIVSDTDKYFRILTCYNNKGMLINEEFDAIVNSWDDALRTVYDKLNNIPNMIDRYREIETISRPRASDIFNPRKSVNIEINTRQGKDTFRLACKIDKCARVIHEGYINEVIPPQKYHEVNKHIKCIVNALGVHVTDLIRIELQIRQKSES